MITSNYLVPRVSMNTAFLSSLVHIDSSQLFLIAIITAILSVTYFILWYPPFQWNLPPLAPLSYTSVLKHIADGSLHKVCLDLSRSELGPVFRLRWIGYRHGVFVVTDGKLMREILENADLSDKTSFSRYVLNKVTLCPNILSKYTKGDGWDWARKGVAPAFSNVNLYKTLPRLSDKLAKFCEILDDKAEKGEVMEDWAAWCTRLTIDLISSSMFSSNFDTIHDHSTDHRGWTYIQQFPVVLREFAVLNAGRLLRPLMFWKKEARAAADGAKAIHDVSQSLIEDYRRSMHPSDDSTILGHLMRSPYPTDKDRIADISIFMFAGHDTTAYQLSLLMVQLARHPLVVEKLREELDSVYAGTEGPLKSTPTQLSQLTYLSMVIKEGMRLDPVVAGGPNRTLKQKVQYGNYTIPAGSLVKAAFYSTFRSPCLSSPDTFDPSRWEKGHVDEDYLKILFMPFSAGRRNCAGQNLALLELRLVLATFYYSYDFELVNPELITESLSVTLKPKNVQFRVHKRSS